MTAVDLQAQAGTAQVAAKQGLELKTAHGVVNIAAAKKVVLAVWALFEGTFAQTAIAYSPWVLSLSANDDARAEELGWLDAHCQHLPIVSVLALNVEPAIWVTHLRRCLSMDLEDDGFL